MIGGGVGFFAQGVALFGGDVAAEFVLIALAELVVAGHLAGGDFYGVVVVVFALLEQVEFVKGVEGGASAGGVFHEEVRHGFV